nr:integrase, catalytic region, zinc finger, CCHC-type, peptidase aspartic, catalytic [Tanacetum cinerariifolium]
MLDRTDFASWQQRIRLYCQGKKNEVNILKSIDEGPYQMGTVREPLAEGTQGAPHLGPERPRVYSDLSPEEKDRYYADIRATNILLQGLPKDIYTLINPYTDAKDIWDNVKMLLEGGYKYHPLHVISYPLDQIRTVLSYVEEPEAILDRQDRVMRKKTIPFVKILWRNHPEREATWETEESIRTSYPHFLP